MKFSRLALSIFFSTQFFLAANLVSAEGEEETGEERYSLCSKFPNNSKCEGFTAPVSLKTRSGEKGQCITSNLEESEKCKIDITEESITLYMETGDKLTVLEEAKDTSEIIIPLDLVKSFTYSEENKINVGAVLASGVWGLLSKKKTSTFNVRLDKEKEATEENILPKQVVFAVKRGVGKETRKFLEEQLDQPAELLDLDLEL